MINVLHIRGSRLPGEAGSVYVRLRSESSRNSFAQNLFVGRRSAMATESHALATAVVPSAKGPEALFGDEFNAPFAVACASETVSRRDRKSVV